jgi:type I site-specific restriction-modification system R (restriction) subunit
MEQETKKIVEEELEAKVQEIENRFQTQIEQELELVKEQLKVITASTSRIEQIEKDFQRHMHEDLEEIRNELKVISTSTSKLEGEISDKWNILVKLRSHSYDKLMSEYKKVEKKILIEAKTSEDIAPEEKKEI